MSEDHTHDAVVTEMRDFIKAGHLDTIYLTIEGAVARGGGYQTKLRTYLAVCGGRSLLNDYILQRIDMERFERANLEWKEALPRIVTKENLQQLVDAIINKALELRRASAGSGASPAARDTLGGMDGVKPIPALGQKWRSNEGVTGEIAGLEDEYAAPIEEVSNETTGEPALANYFVVLTVPKVGPVRVQEHTFLANWEYLPDA